MIIDWKPFHQQFLEHLPNYQFKVFHEKIALRLNNDIVVELVPYRNDGWYYIGYNVHIIHILNGLISENKFPFRNYFIDTTNHPQEVKNKFDSFIVYDGPNGQTFDRNEAVWKFLHPTIEDLQRYCNAITEYIKLFE
jgi:hypothetical protein